MSKYKNEIDKIRDEFEEQAATKLGEELIDAIFDNRMDIVEVLINNGADLNVVDGEWTPLKAGILSRNIPALKLLAKKGASVDIPDLLLFCQLGFEEKIIENVFEKNPNLDFNHAASPFLLSLVCGAGHINITKILVNNGVKWCHDLNGYIESPLIFACRNGNVEIVEFLINSGFDQNVFSKNSESFIDMYKVLVGDKVGVVDSENIILSDSDLSGDNNDNSSDNNDN